MVYTLRFFPSSNCSLFHKSNVFGSCIIHILYTVCAKIKKKFRRQKVKSLTRQVLHKGFKEMGIPGREIRTVRSRNMWHIKMPAN